MAPFNNPYFWLIGYIIYSIGGLFVARNYVLACKDAKVQSFNGSIGRMVIMMVASGGITTLMLFMGVIGCIKDELTKRK